MLNRQRILTGKWSLAARYTHFNALLKTVALTTVQLRNKESNKPFFVEQPIARPQKTKKVLQALTKAQVMGKTLDGNTIYLTAYRRNSALIKEIGRLREFTFRKVGEGTGSKRDLDEYDKDYLHLILWNDKHSRIIGAYRIGEAGKLIARHSSELYTTSLFHFSDALTPYLKQTLELGRSFVHPDFWGKNSLDYLWQGIGAFLRHHPEIRYLLGPVSISANYPRPLIDELVFYFEHFYPASAPLAKARRPYPIPLSQRQALHARYGQLDKRKGLQLLQDRFKEAGHKIPVLLKQYTAIYEDDGVQVLAFSVDPQFGNCVDVLLLADLTKLKAKKRERYIGKPV